jgi:hypothetical protein
MKALCDTGVNISLSISPETAMKAVKHFGAKLKALLQAI